MMVPAAVVFAAAASHVEPRIVDAYAAALGYFNRALPPASRIRLARDVIADSDAAGLDARLVVALVAAESSWDPHAVSRAGAEGLGQLMPATASGLGVDPFDPDANVRGTVVHLAGLLRRYRAYPETERVALAVAAYNAGAGAVERYRGVPPYRETQTYVRRVVGLWLRLAGR